MSCTQGRNQRWLTGILSAVGVNILLLFFISLFFQPRTSPRRLPSVQPVPVWQVEHLRQEPEPEVRKKAEPLKKNLSLPPVPLEPLPRLQPEKSLPFVLPTPKLSISPRISKLEMLTPLIQPEKLFYQAGELDKQPLPVNTPAPMYPVRARLRGIEGKVRVRFLVDKLGLVKKVEIIKAEPEGYFERAVRTTLSSWRFRPGMVENNQVQTQVETTIVFKLDR